MRPHASRRIAAQRCWEGGVLVRAAMLLSMRGEEARRILAKRSQWGACLLDPARNRPAVAGNDRRPRSIVSGLLFTMNGATRTCDTGIWRSSETLAPRARGTALVSPRVSHGAGTGVGRGVRGELAVELGEQRNTIGEAIFGAGRGERGVLRRRRAVDEEARARKRLEYGGEGGVADPVVRPGQA